MSQSEFILRVLTINIWNRSGPWEKRLEMLRHGIAALDPHVVALQEVVAYEGTSLAHAIAEGTDYEVTFGEAKALPADFSFGNAVLSKFPLLRHEVFPLPSAGTDESRSLLLTELDVPTAPLPFMSTHLSWRFHHGYVREEQVQALARAIKQHVPVDQNKLPPIICGDFNASPEATEIRFLRGLHALNKKSIYLADCFGEVGQGPGYTFEAAINPFAAFTHEAARRIDYIFVRGPDKRGRGKPLNARVVLNDVVDGVAPSDHWGVYAELAM